MTYIASSVLNRTIFTDMERHFSVAFEPEQSNLNDRLHILKMTKAFEKRRAYCVRMKRNKRWLRLRRKTAKGIHNTEYRMLPFYLSLRSSILYFFRKRAGMKSTYGIFLYKCQQENAQKCNRNFRVKQSFENNYGLSF